MTIPTPVRQAAAALGAVALAATLVACGSSSDDTTAAGPSGGAGTSAGAISAQRCAQNEAAGTITYLSGYSWQASASILEVVAAADLGYYKDLCLDVKLEPGGLNNMNNAQILQSGKAQITPLSEQDVITNNADTVKNGGSAGIVGISSYSNSGLDVLLTMPSTTSLSQLEGETAGQKGYVPLAVAAMLGKAGVDSSAIKWTTVGYDPTVLPRGQVQGLTAFVSNEPNLLKDAGYDVTTWDPATYGVPSSLGAFAANTAFAQKNPTAVEDFLRATFKAFDYCSQSANVDQCISFQQKQMNDPTDKAAHEKQVWQTESAIVGAHPVPGTWGSVDPANVKKLTADLKTYQGVSVDSATAASWFDDTYVDAVVKGSTVIWPAP